MPIGCYSLVGPIADLLWRRRPAAVLDLGAGMGFYGAVVRQWCDSGVQPWRTRLIGVEGFEGYRNPCWNLYDEIHVTPIEEFVALGRSTWDAIFLLDVLEHFEKEQGASLLTRLRSMLTNTGILLVGTPAVFTEQDAAYNNEMERHRSLWTATELADAGLCVLSDGEPDQWGNRMALAILDHANIA